MGYDFGRYSTPPAAPALPANLHVEVALPGKDDLGFAAHLQPPPLEAVRTSGLDVVRDLSTRRTPEGDAWATYMDHKGATSMWWNAGREMREDLGPVRGSLATGVLVATQAAALLATSLPGQHHYQRERPFQVDPQLTTVGQRPTNSSYPSGHTRQAYAMARLVSRLDPQRADEAYGLARQVADSRMYAGMHFPADVQAGAALGTGIGDTMADGALRAARAGSTLAAATTSTAASVARGATRAAGAARDGARQLWNRFRPAADQPAGSNAA